MMPESFKRAKWIDLTHTLHPDIPTWGGGCGFKHSIENDYSAGCRTHVIDMKEGIGTHMDAPSHFIPNTQDISAVPIEKLIVPTYVIDISNRNDPFDMLSEADLKTFENQHGKILENSLVIAYTGWDKYWKTPIQYRNQNKEGGLTFPGFSKTSAEILVERKIAGIGIDTLSPDGSDMTFPVHKLILGAGCYIIENLTQCHMLPATGAFVIALPIKIQSGTEAPIRAIALV
jgi:kynurenine formamidase